MADGDCEIQAEPDGPTIRELVDRLESEVESMPQADCPVRNIFAPGIYAREMTIPAGVVATGAVHKTEHLTIISAGRLIITSGDDVKEVSAPHIFVSKPGAKRAVYAIEDTVLTTIHPTDETDIDKLVELLTESKSCELLGGSENRQLLANAEAAKKLEN